MYLLLRVFQPLPKLQIGNQLLLFLLLQAVLVFELTYFRRLFLLLHERLLLCRCLVLFEFCMQSSVLVVLLLLQLLRKSYLACFFLLWLQKLAIIDLPRVLKSESALLVWLLNHCCRGS